MFNRCIMSYVIRFSKYLMQNNFANCDIFSTFVNRKITSLKTQV